MGNEFIEINLEKIWHSWLIFKKGKHFTQEMHHFQYHLEKNLYALFQALNMGRYRHGDYKNFVVCDNKRREISVASIQDRVVHRLLYDYLTKIYDKTFIYDAWSCRIGKGLLGAIKRTQIFLSRYPRAYTWKADVKKFFDSVDHKILFKILWRKVTDPVARNLLRGVIESFSKKEGKNIGMPIGNLTSQIFANIYLNELDRFVQHALKPCAYVRYGDDFILFHVHREQLVDLRKKTTDFLIESLHLKIQPKNDIIVKTRHGLRFLGVILYPKGRKLSVRNEDRVKHRLNLKNAGSYFGLLKAHGNEKLRKEFDWHIVDHLL